MSGFALYVYLSPTYEWECDLVEEREARLSGEDYGCFAGSSD